MMGSLQTNETLKLASTTAHYASDSLRWYCPAPLKIPSWKILLVIFNNQLWIIIISTSIAMIGFCYILDHKKHLNRLWFYFTHIFLIHLANARQQTPGISESLKLFLAVASFYGIIVSYAYQGEIISILSTSIFESTPLTLSEVIKTKKFGFGWINSSEFLLKNPDWKYKYIIKNAYLCEDIKKCLISETLTKRKLCTLNNMLHVKYLTPALFLDGQGNKLIYTLRQRMLSFYAVLVLQRHSILLEDFNAYIRRLVSGGIIEKWLDEIHTTYKLPEQDDYIIRLYDLEGPLYFVIIGLFVSTCAFGLELILHGRDINRFAKMKIVDSKGLEEKKPSRYVLLCNVRQPYVLEPNKSLA